MLWVRPEREQSCAARRRLEQQRQQRAVRQPQQQHALERQQQRWLPVCEGALVFVLLPLYPFEMNVDG